jgi:LuxR family transcriptional regulator, regulator of acetate metabolism
VPTLSRATSAPPAPRSSDDHGRRAAQPAIREALAAAQQVLELEPATAGAGDERARLRKLITLAGERVSAAGGSVASAEHDAALERLRQRFEGRSEALARARAAVAELREVSSPATMLARAPAALCLGSTLARVILSAVRDGTMIAEAAHFAGDPDGARRILEQLRAAPVALEHPLVETELLRRRRATIVVDAHVHPRVHRRTAELMSWRSYVAAPLLVGSSVIGVIHADRGAREPLDVLDREILWEFATGLSQAYETASLRRTLRHEREQMRQFLEWLGGLSGALTDAPITLAAPRGAPLPPPEPIDGSAPVEGRDDRVVFAGLLTPRELDVLRLLAEGNANKAIADALVVSDATVKFHVASLLRKLRVANRAEAVSRYLALLGMRAP